MTVSRGAVEGEEGGCASVTKKGLVRRPTEDKFHRQASCGCGGINQTGMGRISFIKCLLLVYCQLWVLFHGAAQIPPGEVPPTDIEGSFVNLKKTVFVMWPGLGDACGSKSYVFSGYLNFSNQDDINFDR